jgi:predicted outer membrane lipoprotein
VEVAIKLVWAYAIAVLLGGLGMVMYAKWQASGSWAGFAAWLVGASLAAAFGVRRGMKKRREIDADEAARRG